MSARPKIMLLACGSYNPVTPLHLRMFELARDHFNETESHQVVGGILSPVHDSYRKKDLISSRHRLSMAKISLKNSDWIRLSDWECQQEEWTRTRLTLQYHQNYVNSYSHLNIMDNNVNDIIPSWLPGNMKEIAGDIKLKLLCGADLLESFSVPGLWKNEDIEAIVGQHGIVVVTRSGSDPNQYIFNSDILYKHRKNISIVTEWIPNEVSSTMIRRLLNRGKSVKYILNDNLIEYIRKNNLYGVNSSLQFIKTKTKFHAAWIISKYILTPNQNEKIFITTEENFNNKNLQQNSEDEEEMDETDYVPFLNRSKVFCCDPLNVKGLLNRPGQAVQILTDATSHRVIEEEVGVVLVVKNKENDENVEEEDDDDENTDSIDEIELRPCFSDDEGLPHRLLPLPSTSSRNNDTIKFVFTEHGIRVISDKEYVV